MDGEQMSFSTREIRLIKTVPKICMLKSVTGALWIFFGLVDMSFVFKARINGLYIIALWAIAGALFALSKRSVNEGRKVLTQSNFDYRDESDLRRKFVMVNLIQYGAILAAGFATYLYSYHTFFTLFPFLLCLIVAAHFFPLGRMFGSLPLYLTGAAILAIAATAWIFSPSGAYSYFALVGTGIIVWSSVIYDLKASSAARKSAEKSEKGGRLDESKGKKARYLFATVSYSSIECKGEKEFTANSSILSRFIRRCKALLMLTARKCADINLSCSGLTNMAGVMTFAN
jgi:hypothetical protein